MKKLLSVFKKRWLISLLGILALALIVWFLGPLLAIADWEPLVPELNRLLTISIMLLLWGLNQLRKYLVAKRKNAQMLEGLAQAPPDPTQTASEEEIAELKGRFDAALKILKHAKLDRRSGGHNYLYQLPWYIIIGPPGCGKTTALINSGLNFPLAERFGNEIQGVGGTRNCDWFFTDEAVLLDTAGRYATQDSHQEVDRSAWLGFLELLKKHRRRRPINGIMVAISIRDLMGLGVAQRGEHAHAIKQRIQELHQHLGIRFPIYVLFTKCDLMAGFMEFFNDLGREERNQVWGMTFPMDDLEGPKGVVENFPAEFDALERQLNERLVERLQQERDSQRRQLIHTFPQQFSALKQVAEQFLYEIFHPSRFEERALLRGVYFTSGTQEGTPIDRIMGALAASFQLDRQSAPSFSGAGKSFFITRLFQDVVFHESGLAGANLRLERQRAWLQRSAYAGVLLITVLAVTAWFTSYARNQAYIADVRDQAQIIETEAEELSPAQNGVLAVLPLLDKARGIPGGYRDREASAPVLMGLGLYQGDKLGATGAMLAYRRLLDGTFLPRLMLRLEEQLQQGGVNDDYLYEALKVYLMLNDPAHFNADAVKAWIAFDWEQNLSRQINATRREALTGHLDALLEKLPDPLPYAQDPNLIRSVQQRLTRVPIAQRIYARLKQEGLGETIPPFRINEAAGRDAPLVFMRNSGEPLNQGIPGLYTYEGYHEVFVKQSGARILALADESWILGPLAQISTDPEELRHLSDRIRELYLRDYAQQWLDLLADVSIRPLSNLPEAVAIMTVLAGADSPLSKLIVAVDHETSLDRVTQDDAPDLVDKAGGKVAKKMASKIPGAGKLRQLFGKIPAAESKAPTAQPPNYVEERFARIHQLVQAQGQDAILLLLNELLVYLDAIASAADQGGAALSAAKKQAGGVIKKLKLEASRQPPPLNRWLESLASDSYDLTLGGVKAHLNAIWSADVLPLWQQGIYNRYPLARASSQEATLADFGRFFGPGGLIDSFFQEFLQPFVDTSRNPWQWRVTGGDSPAISAEALTAFQRAAAIKQAFFQSGGQTPSVRFELEPITMDPQATQFLLDLDGQKVTYRHGPTRPYPLQWPGQQGYGRVQIMFSPPATGGRSGFTEEGPWAWFRILDRARIRATQDPERFTVTFRVDDRQARFKLRASSAFNPFGLKAVGEFKCPQRL